MASLRIINRQKKRELLVLKYSVVRDRLRALVKDPKLTQEDRQRYQMLMQKLPKDSNKCRLRNRCFKTGRGNGVYRTVGLCRNMFRYYAMKGDIPGLRKSSW